MINFKVMKLFSYLFFLLFPILYFGQNSKDMQDVYNVLNAVVLNKKLDKKRGINLIPYQTYKPDKDILNEYLIKKVENKTQENLNGNKASDIVVPELTYPDKNLLSEKEIDEMLKFKQKFKNFKWNNKFLNFDTRNKTDFYEFSIPFMNKNRDKVIVQYFYRCPGLCGNDIIVYLEKKAGRWEMNTLSTSIH